MSAARGPFYLGPNSDPEYAYLLNAAGLLELHAPNHTDHPGTPVQVASAVVIGGTWLIAGQDSLVPDVLKRPEFYLGAIGVAFSLFLVLLLIIAGLAAFYFTRSIMVVICVQATPLLSTHTVNALGTVRPEILLVTMALALGASVLWVWNNPERLDRRSTALWFGALAGLGVAIKITFAPLALIPLILLITRRQRITYLVAAGVAFLVCILPILVRLRQIVRWNYNLFIHTGIHGQGETGVVNFSAYGSNLKMLLSHEPALLIFALAGILCAVAFRSHAQRDAQTALAWRATLGISVVELLQFVIVAKHPNPHYLLTAMALLGTHAACMVLLLRETRVAIPAAMAGLLAALIFVVPSIPRQREALAAHRDAMAEFQKRIDEKTRGGVTVYYHRCSAPAYALKFGDDFCGSYFSPRLETHFRDNYFYNVWKKKLSSSARMLTASELIAEAGTRPIYFRGESWDLVPPEFWPEGFTFQRIDGAGAEVLYLGVPK